ncbi:family 43 glycosylhydrolase [Alkalihalobacillus trypoxylicola]|uniref:Arabinan endo-1,5-alpha-L-arabinosidase n=1 Tax=Alkalihalobacillus trypoxylicola TaxID=519424 RepID=A0A161QFP7_9BACI|nr:family 43 glycosylhydrolase [Alkalihalobacillus trypoxylicola]KYG27709.1 arabinan endo-1,5-alpha-L-arabinosidase [Alkalihalobacillus trypoxylicola]
MKIKWWSIVGLLIIVLIGVFIYQFFNQEKSGEEYQNPIFEPVIADPSIIKGEDGFYYAYGTEDNWGDGMGPRIVPIVKSENLVDWQYVGDAFNEKPSWKEDGGIWAPDISFYNEKYYLYYSQSTWGDSNPAIGVAVSNTPTGPFEDQGKLFDSEEIEVNNSIDPQLFVEDDGTPYLFWGSWYGIWGIELSDDGLDYIGEKFQIASTSFEAPYIVKKEDEYIFFGSKGSCCEGQFSEYRVAVGKADSLEGPYFDQSGNDLLYSSGTVILAGGDQFKGPGHNAVVTDEAGQDWMIYHAIDADNPWVDGGITRRPLMMDRIIWEDGWPEIKGGVPSEGVQEGPITK